LKVDALVWEMKNGAITSVKIEGEIFNCNGNKVDRYFGGRKPVINKWIKDKKIGSSFNLEEFFKDHPHLRVPSKIERTNNELSRLVRCGVLLQTSNSSFKVLK